MTNGAPGLPRQPRSIWVSFALGALAVTVLVSTILLAALILVQMQDLSQGVERSQNIVNSNMRALSQAQREILRLTGLLERDDATAEQISLLRGFVGQRVQEASLPYQVFTLGSERLYEISLELRDRWQAEVEPLITQIMASPAAASREQYAAAIQQLQALELGYNRLVADGEINRRLQGAALNEAANNTLETTRRVITVLGLSAVAFVCLAAVAAFNTARLTAQREAATKALVEANRNLQTLSAVASRTRNMVVVADANGNIEWVNNAFVTSTGYTLEEAKGKRPGDLLQGKESDPETIRYMNERLMAGQGFEAEIINYTKGGQTYWIAIEVQPIVNEAGTLTNFVAMETDITFRKQTETALRAALEQEREARELKSRFVSMTSHELRTPLTTILTLSDFLKMADSSLTPEQRAERLDKIELAARQISALVDDVLHYDRTDTIWLQFSPQPVDLIELVRGLISELSAEPRHRYVCHLPEQPIVVMGDRPMLRQIVLNLLTNAAKYSTPPQPIDVELSSDGGMAVLRVRDRGIGIPVIERKHVFEPFFRGANTGGISGTGLGLAITRNAIDLHQGEISFESEEGQGTIFTVRLPLAAAQDTPA
ncbi:MAG: PAS domain S-box protein [Anaerolineae bacterium]|nr:PAS domain S-box protein [Anaerolineae bacterium]